jgi:hypothetical protein
VLEKISPVKNPLTIIAIFAGIVEVSGVYVLPRISSDLQGTYIWFLMLFPSCLVGAFFTILYKKHYVLYSPSDYKEDITFTRFFDKDFEDNKILSVTKSVSESVTDIVKENIQNIDYDNPNISVSTNKKVEEAKKRIIESVTDKCKDYIVSYDDNFQRIKYNKEANSFEYLVFDILNDLNIPCTLTDIPKNGFEDIDIIAKNKIGKEIPIEVKYYQSSIEGTAFSTKLALQILQHRLRFQSNELVLIVSSGISNDAISKIRTVNKDAKIHIVTGNTMDVLVPQLKSIFLDN